jgi:hypothetical protein
MNSLLHTIGLAMIGFWGLPAGLFAADPLLKIRYQDQWLTGKVVHHSSADCWFVSPAGQLQQIPFKAVTEYETVGTFQAKRPAELRESLVREFGRSYRVAVASPYVVVGEGDSAERLSPLFDQLYRQFFTSFRARGLPVHQAEFPLVAVVLPTRQRFEEYCKAEGVPASSGLLGYYLPSSNRVALYEQRERANATGLDDTVIHEAVHQVAFNVGVHSRLGANPKWVVEGLATVWEREAVRLGTTGATRAALINPERFDWFAKYQQQRRPAMGLTQVVGDERLFATAPLDAYAESWLLTFFLLETRSAEYSRYLKKLAARDPDQKYSSEERLSDFSASFGKDLAILDAQLLRFFEQLQVDVSDGR